MVVGFTTSCTISPY